MKLRCEVCGKEKVFPDGMGIGAYGWCWVNAKPPYVLCDKCEPKESIWEV